MTTPNTPATNAITTLFQGVSKESLSSISPPSSSVSSRYEEIQSIAPVYNDLHPLQKIGHDIIHHPGIVYHGHMPGMRQHHPFR
mmetsp:Transcript_24722/g.37642  ORF Transcript_24722/g.37642 Transcript_24722/m.37642 type:complete len:84 (-) Transcript_24722:852-1103(-)